VGRGRGMGDYFSGRGGGYVARGRGADFIYGGMHNVMPGRMEETDPGSDQDYDIVRRMY